MAEKKKKKKILTPLKHSDFFQTPCYEKMVKVAQTLTTQKDEFRPHEKA